MSPQAILQQKKDAAEAMLPPQNCKQPSHDSKENIVSQKVLKDQQQQLNINLLPQTSFNKADVSIKDASSNSGEADDSSIASELKTPQPGVLGCQFVTPSSG